jgi:prepilin-type N-terminal cleavage/methylation domain-containing protein
MTVYSAVQKQSGFSLIELIVATSLLLVVSSIVIGALLQTSNSQRTISNRTAMHSGVRGATELLQQEVGQAGRISLPGTPTLTGAVTKAVLCDGTNPSLNAATVNVSSTAGMFPNMVLTTLDGDSSETVKVTAVPSTTTITACFSKDHAASTPLTVLGAFATGVVPPTGIVNGSSDTVLKLYGDINDDGNMVYIEYTCDAAGSGNLYRNVMAFNAASKPAITDAQILLSNIIPNPGGTPCFIYQTSTITVGATPFTFVLDVAVTLTVETEQLDPITKTYQTETKALLNVSPRNVFHAWSYAGMGYSNRIQSTPVSITTLLP